MLVVFRHKTHTHKTHKTKKTKAKQLNVTLDRHAFGFGTAFEPEKVEEVAPCTTKPKTRTVPKRRALDGATRGRPRASGVTRTLHSTPSRRLFVAVCCCAVATPVPHPKATANNTANSSVRAMAADQRGRDCCFGD